MKTSLLPLENTVTLERVVRIEPDVIDEDGTLEDVPASELDPGTYAVDSEGRVWRQVQSVTGLLQAATQHDPDKKRRLRGRTL